ncbi:MAG: hypothetical protein O2793_14730 [Proteobacteria bacterium]|nr:hypothetical protein [Pseudomonadota bacterium]MDA1253933.1 hypothetical protein [Pseudomonadota bacterium]
MALIFDPIPIAENNYQLNEIAFNDALKVAAIDPKLNEKRITAFLSFALNNSQLPLSMTVQERYFLMLKYVQKQTNTLFSTATDLSNCFKDQTEFLNEITEVGITVRQLNGTEAEYLEAKCVNAAEWIACLLAFQIKYDGHEHLGTLPDRNANNQVFSQQFTQRLNYLKALPQSEFNLIYLDFQKLSSQLYTYVELGINNEGFVVERGADDAPLRFRASTCFIGIIKELDKSFN